MVWSILLVHADRTCSSLPLTVHGRVRSWVLVCVAAHASDFGCCSLDSSCRRSLHHYHVHLVRKKWEGLCRSWESCRRGDSSDSFSVVTNKTFRILISSWTQQQEPSLPVLIIQIISQVRTVYSFVGEDRAVESYSNSLDNGLELGKKSGIAKGVGVGSTYALLFCSWALLLWYAGLLVRHHVTSGGKAFTTIINVIFSGL